MSLASCLTALPRNMWCQTLVTLQAGQRYELQLHASATGIDIWSAGVDSNHHMAAYKTASLNHWRTRGFWCGMTGSNRRPIACKAIALPTELTPHNTGLGLTRNTFGLIPKCHHKQCVPLSIYRKIVTPPFQMVSGGADVSRTRDILLARQVLSQLSYNPIALPAYRG